MPHTRPPDHRRPATLLHTSDCHLAGRDGGPEEPAFTSAIDLAVEVGVDAVLITGDLFDHARVPDSLLDWTVAELDRLPCPVVMIPGNHDVFDEQSVHHRFTVSDRCDHVQFIDDEDGRLVEVPGTDIVVWGRAMPEHEPEFRPLVGVPPVPAGRWSIVAGHGLLMEDDEPTYRSSPIYASDLDAVRWDYVALGHIHRYWEIRNNPTPARYAGATASSLDGVPGVVLVDFVPGDGAQPRWVSLATVDTTA
jgi:DNA repair exonuclease SbcCD nuclease subunit